MRAFWVQVRSRVTSRRELELNVYARWCAVHHLGQEVGRTLFGTTATGRVDAAHSSRCRPPYIPTLQVRGRSSSRDTPRTRPRLPQYRSRTMNKHTRSCQHPRRSRWHSCPADESSRSSCLRRSYRRTRARLPQCRGRDTRASRVSRRIPAEPPLRLRLWFHRVVARFM